MHLADRKSFTLVELLVVIGILAILTAAVVIVLNPAELLKQSRDSSRMTDVASMQKAVQLLMTQNPSVSIGTASTVYVSLADSSSTCGSLGLPALPAGYSYHCAPAASLSSIDGSGWMPVNLSSSGIQNLPRLPLDPLNTSSTGMYYTYTVGANGTFEITASVESKKYASRGAGDGGANPFTFEAGSNLALMPSVMLGRSATYDTLTTGDPSLAAYWKFDEGSGTTASDASGNGNAATLYNGAAWAAGKMGQALNLNKNYALAPSLNSSGYSAFTVSAWGYLTDASGGDASSWTTAVRIGTFQLGTLSGKTVVYWAPPATTKTGSVLPLGSWHHLAWTASKDGPAIVYLDGKQDASIALSAFPVSTVFYIGCWTLPASQCWIGSLDDLRVYNRALSAAEIQTIYNATK